MTESPHAQIERLLDSEDGHARLAAELSAPSGAPSRATPDTLAARLAGDDGADAIFAANPEAMQDLAAAAAFMAAIDAERQTAPADLVAAAIGTRQPVRQSGWRWAGLQWRWTGAAIGLALAALAAILIVSRQPPVDPKAPLIARPEPAKPVLLPAGSAEKPPATRPRLAPETPDVMR